MLDASEHVGANASHYIDAAALVALQQTASKSLSEAGYLHIRTTALDTKAALRTINAVVSHFATQIKIFDDKPLWREIGAKLDRPFDRSEGIGASPLHMDFVNAELPPDYVCLYCVRPDPQGGGKSLVAPIDEAIDAIKSDHQKQLCDKVFRDGAVVNLSNIGGDINPFAICSPAAKWKFRFTAHLRSGALAAEYAEALEGLLFELIKRQKSVKLIAGDALFMDQRRVVHGKTALGSLQEHLQESSRRLLLHGFYRENPSKEKRRGSDQR